MTAIYLIGLGGVLAGPVMLPVVPGIGVQMPDDAIELGQELAAPAEGFVWALVDGAAVQLADHRGTVYSTASGEAQQFVALGELPEGLTIEPPPGQFYVWGAGAWQLDEQAQESAQAFKTTAERDGRMGVAQLRIAPLQYAVNLDMATEQEQSALLAWMRYSVELNRINQQPGYPLTVEWPVSPDAL